jgi:hypothetical protein
VALEYFKKSLVITSLLMITLPAVAGNLYRWMDETGRVHISDKIPPEATQRAYDIINAQGRVVKHVAAPLTEEELAVLEARRVQEQEALRAKKEQERKDRILTLTYGTVDEIEFARQERLALIEAQIKLHEKRLREKAAERNALNKKTQRYSDEDRPVPEGLMKRERRVMEEEAALMEMIRMGEIQYQNLNERFMSDINRFKYLQKQKAKPE